MENKNVGLIIIGIAVMMVIIVLLFNAGIGEIASQTCDHADTCTHRDALQTQTMISLSIIGIIIIIGFVIMFTKPKVEIKEKIVVKKVKEKKKKIDTKSLEKSEKQVVELLQAENNAMFQADLMEKLEIGKVKMTRLLDKLEAKQLIERKRRGMNNLVVLRE